MYDQLNQAAHPQCSQRSRLSFVGPLCACQRLIRRRSRSIGVSYASMGLPPSAIPFVSLAEGLINFEFVGCAVHLPSISHHAMLVEVGTYPLFLANVRCYGHVGGKAEGGRLPIQSITTSLPFDAIMPALEPRDTTHEAHRRQKTPKSKKKTGEDRTRCAR